MEAEKTEAKEVVPSVESVDDAAEEGFTEVVKQKKKQKNKKADKMEENVALLEATIAKECREEHVAVDVADTTPKVIEKAVEASEVVDKAVEAAEVVDEVVATAEVVDEVVEAAEVVDEVMDEGNMEVVKSKKKKKKSETRKNFQVKLRACFSACVVVEWMLDHLNYKKIMLYNYSHHWVAFDW